MTVQELRDQLDSLCQQGHGDCDVKVETNICDRDIANVTPDVTDGCDDFPVTLLRLEWPRTGPFEWGE